MRHVPFDESCGTLTIPVHGAPGAPACALNQIIGGVPRPPGTGPSARPVTLATPLLSSVTSIVTLTCEACALLTTDGDTDTDRTVGGVESQCPDEVVTWKRAPATAWLFVS